MLGPEDLRLVRRWTARLFLALAGFGLVAAIAAPLVASTALDAVGKGLLLLYGLPVLILAPVRAVRHLLLQVNGGRASR
jgi:hypothetical protein